MHKKECDDGVRELIELLRDYWEIEPIADKKLMN